MSIEESLSIENFWSMAINIRTILRIKFYAPDMKAQGSIGVLGLMSKVGEL